MEPLFPEIACFETAPEIVPSMPQALACAPDAFKEHRKHRSLFANGSRRPGALLVLGGTSPTGLTVEFRRTGTRCGYPGNILY
jgi:hypothetical protein